MYKAFGYGNGGLRLNYSNTTKVDYLGVYFCPAYFIKNVGIHLPIMVLNLIKSSSFAAIIQYKLEPEEYCLKGLLCVSKKLQRKTCIIFPSN
jgi:alanine racemase